MKDRIIQATMVQIYKFGFRKFTVDDLAMDLGISKKTIYKYFKSKDELISVTIEQNIEVDRQNTIKAVAEAKELIDKLRIAILFHHKDKISTYLLDELHRFFPQEWAKFATLKEFKINLIKELLLQGIDCGIIRSDISIDIVLLIIEKSVLAILDYDTLRQRDLSINQAIEEIEKVVFYGIAK